MGASTIHNGYVLKHRKNGWNIGIAQPDGGVAWLRLDDETNALYYFGSRKAATDYIDGLGEPIGKHTAAALERLKENLPK